MRVCTLVLTLLGGMVAASGWPIARPAADDTRDAIAALARARTKDERRAVFKGKDDDFIQAVVMDLFQVQERLVQAGEFGQLNVTQVWIEEATDLIKDPDTKVLCEVLALLGKGRNEQVQQRYDEAVPTFDRAMALARKHGMKTVELMILVNLGAGQAHQGDFLGAIKTLEDTRKQLADLNALARGIIEAPLLNNLGHVYTETGDHIRAERTLTDARKLAEKAADAGTARNARVNLAHLQTLRGQYDPAIRLYEQVLAECRKAKQPAMESQILNSLGLALAEQGRTGEALRRLEEARKLAAGLKLRRSEALALGNLALVHDRLGDEEDALRYAADALTLFRAVGDKAGVARCLRMRGMWQLFAGQTEDAEKTFAECLELIKATGSKRALAELSFVLGFQYEKAGQPKKAEDAYTAAAKAYGELGDRYREALARVKKARIERPDGFVEFDLLELNALKPVVARINDPRLTATYHDTRANWHFERKEWPEAVKELKAAIKAAESRFTDIEDPLLQASETAGSLSSLHANLAVALAAAGDPAGVFEVAERAKARSLTDLLERSRVTVQKGMTAQERGEEARLRGELVAAANRGLAALRFQADDEKAQAESDKARADAQFHYDEFRRKTFLAHPELGTQRGELSPVTLTELQKSLFAAHPDLAIVSYMVNRSRTVIVVVTAGDKPDGPAKVVAHTVTVRATELATEAEKYWKACQNPAAGAPSSDKLWDWLIAPAQKELAGKKHVVIVPTAPLLKFPFQALRKRNGAYLIEEYAISYAPSVSALLAMRRQGDATRAAAGTVPVVALGGAKFTSDLARLPATEREAKAVAELYGNNPPPLLADRATRGEVIRQARAARYLHLATHGLPNESRPLFSALAVTPSKDDDGRLYAHDVMNLELKAELVTLSACETGRGRDFRGEGTVGLAWAFFVAGSPAVVVSQWKVADGSTADLMTRFYQQLKDGATKADALRTAQLALLKERDTRHPFFWAPFLVQGDWRK